MRQSSILLFLGSFVCTNLALSPEATCYFPDGGIASGNYPCFLDQTDSACCATGSICEASGLCKVPRSIGISELIRGACTDSTWTSSSCPNYCTDAAGGGTNVISCQNVTQSDLDFCCDHTNGCCGSGIGRFRVQLNTDILTLGSSGATISTFAPTASFLASSSSIAVSSTSSSSSLTSSGTPYISTSSATNTIASETSTPTSTPNPNEDSSLSTGAKAGIAVGCAIIGLAIVGGIVYLCIRKYRHSHYPSNFAETDSAPRDVAEIDGISSLPEMEARPAQRMGNYQRVELAA